MNFLTAIKMFCTPLLEIFGFKDQILKLINTPKKTHSLYSIDILRKQTRMTTYIIS